jgi:hypothetical protein
MKLQAVCASYGLALDDLAGSFKDEPQFLKVAEWVFAAQGAPPAKRIMRGFIKRVGTLLDLPEDAVDTDLSSLGAVIARAVRSVFAGLILVLSGWAVIGAILTRENEVAAATSVGLTMGILAVAIVWLALLEAAHIGAVALSAADVSELGATHPRVVRPHTHINTKGKLERYLAARQVGVVLTVFLISELTRTPGLRYLPGTVIAIPAGFDILFRIGAPGALLVLVIGQVLPQIITARMPAKLMNTLPMAGAFHVTRVIGLLSLAEPARWMVGWVRGSERIASAARKRYEDTTVDATGYGALASSCVVIVEDHETNVTTVRAVQFHNDEWEALNVDFAVCPSSPNAVAVEAVVIRDGEPVPAEASEINAIQDDGGEGLRLHTTIAPAIGSFKAGDVLRVKAVMRYMGVELGAIANPVSMPTKLAAVRVILVNPVLPVPPARCELTRAGEHGNGRDPRLAPRVRSDGTVEFSALAQYPDLGSRMAVSWSAEAVDAAGSVGRTGTPRVSVLPATELLQIQGKG